MVDTKQNLLPFLSSSSETLCQASTMSNFKNKQTNAVVAPLRHREKHLTGQSDDTSRNFTNMQRSKHQSKALSLVDIKYNKSNDTCFGSVWLN